MSYETEEQQFEKLKEWWNENGTPLMVGAALGLAGFFGWKYWSEKQIAYQMQASDLYNQVLDILSAENADPASLESSAQAVVEQYPESTYAILASFNLAKAAVDNKDLDKAAASLKWVLTNHPESLLSNVAKIRLARVLIEQGQAEQALNMLTVAESSGYYALASLVKGDALMALGRNNDALQAYKTASNVPEVTSRHPSLRLKIDQLSAVDPGVLLDKASTPALEVPTSQDASEVENKVEVSTEQQEVTQ